MPTTPVRAAHTATKQRPFAWPHSRKPRRPLREDYFAWEQNAAALAPGRRPGAALVVFGCPVWRSIGVQEPMARRQALHKSSPLRCSTVAAIEKAGRSSKPISRWLNRQPHGTQGFGSANSTPAGLEDAMVSRPCSTVSRCARDDGHKYLPEFQAEANHADRT